jgi:D-arabinose 1-dehydrogenase-like Zn-dependent alcohol dehydrogenase
MSPSKFPAPPPPPGRVSTRFRPLGRYTQVGHFGRDITVPFDRIGFRQLRVAGSVGYTVATWSRTMRLLAQGLQAHAHRHPPFSARGMAPRLRFV